MSNTFDQLSSALADVVSSAAPSVVRVEARRRLPASGIVWSDDGLIVSANHVVESDDEIRIGLHDGSVTTASVVGRDPATDLIVLRARGERPPRAGVGRRRRSARRQPRHCNRTTVHEC